jgi:hypothetical protein
MAGILNPRVVATKDLSGPFLVEEVLHRCIDYCSGFVIFVSTTGHCNIDTYPCTWVQRGVIVDLSTDPIGWDQSYDHDRREFFDFDSIIQSPDKKMRTITATVDSLPSIMRAIQNALVIVEKLRAIENTLAMNHPCSNPNIQYTPVPIIFDSISLLLQLNHPNNVLSFLHSLKHLDTSTSNEGAKSFASPIVIPVINETLTLSSHRYLEDLSDATITLRNGHLLMARRSTRSGGMFSPSLGPCGQRLIKEIQKFEIDHDGTLRFDVSGKVTSYDEKTSRVQLTIAPTESNMGHQPLINIGKTGKPTLNNDEGPRKSTTSAISGENEPKIYMQSDDPEFLDLDEEDPDDDLDI